MMQNVDRESQRKANEWTNFDMLTVTKAIMKSFFAFAFSNESVNVFNVFDGDVTMAMADHFEKLCTEIEGKEEQNTFMN